MSLQQTPDKQDLKLNPYERTDVIEDLLVSVNPMLPTYNDKNHFGFVPVEAEADITDHAFMVMLNSVAITARLMTVCTELSYDAATSSVRVVFVDTNSEVANSLRTLTGVNHNQTIYSVFYRMVSDHFVLPYFNIDGVRYVANNSREVHHRYSESGSYLKDMTEGRWELHVPVVVAEDQNVEHFTTIHDEVPVPFDVGQVAETLAGMEKLHRVVTTCVYLYSKGELERNEAKVHKHRPRNKNRSKMARKSRKANRKK